MNVTQAYLDSVSYVERYAWFGAQKNLSIVDSVRPEFIFICVWRIDF